MPSGYMVEMLLSCRAQHACATMVCLVCLGRMEHQATAHVRLTQKKRSMQHLQSTCARGASISASGQPDELLAGAVQGGMTPVELPPSLVDLFGRQSKASLLPSRNHTCLQAFLLFFCRVSWGSINCQKSCVELESLTDVLHPEHGSVMACLCRDGGTMYYIECSGAAERGSCPML